MHPLVLKCLISNSCCSKKAMVGFNVMKIDALIGRYNILLGFWLWRFQLYTCSLFEFAFLRDNF